MSVAAGRSRVALRWSIVASLALAATMALGLTSYSQAGPSSPVVHGHRLDHRWVYIQNNFQLPGNVERVNGILDRAAAAGYNGAVFSDVKFGRLDDGSLIPAYFENLRTVLEHAVDLGFEVYPATAAFGYSESILWHAPDLAEALPVRSALFRVEERTLVPYEEEPLRVVNGNFEDTPSDGHEFPGWAWQDAPGVVSFVDKAVRHSGRASLRMTDIGVGNPPHGNGRIMQRLAVRPFQNYHVSVWVKTERFDGGDVRVLALGRDPTRTLQWNEVPVRPTQDWTRFDVTFNTLTHREVLFYLGVWRGETGTIWWDDCTIEPAGFFNVVRRPGAPVRLTSRDEQVAYIEGQDFDRVEDPRMGHAPWPGSFDLWHEMPLIGIPDQSRIAEGDVISASYYQTATIYNHQVTASLTEPAALQIVEGQLASLKRVFGDAGAFRGWMFSHDEIRMHGWDESPRHGDGSPGANLAFNIRALTDAAAVTAPGANVMVWSDMFDPQHNAASRDEPYYLVNGDWSGSWEGLDPGVLVLNWNHSPQKRRASARFFAQRGNRQILAGYYDAPPEGFTDRQWLADLEGIKGISGVMYTQWGSGYDQLEAWADHVWGDAPWVTSEPPETPAPSMTPLPRTPTPAPTAPATDSPEPPNRGPLLLPWAER